jgi:transcriptional regulator with XRE-family HTH domain
MKSPLRQAREKRGMTLGALALKVGSDVGNLSRIERGVQIPNAQLAERICAEFDGEVSELQLIYPTRYVESREPPAPASQPQ